MSSCFGIIVSGRIVQTDFQQMDETKFLININDADNINYLVTFLTGSIPLPVGMAAAVYWSWPDPLNPSKWQYLGHISNSKPSAIFKILHLKKLHELENHEAIMQFGDQAIISHNAQVGISVEPEINVLQQSSNVMTNETSTVFDFGKKMLDNFFNYVSSYTINQAQMTPNPTEVYVPFSSVMMWFKTFQRRLEQNPNFWK